MDSKLPGGAPITHSDRKNRLCYFRKSLLKYLGAEPLLSLRLMEREVGDTKGRPRCKSFGKLWHHRRLVVACTNLSLGGCIPVERENVVITIKKVVTSLNEAHFKRLIRSLLAFGKQFVSRVRCTIMVYRFFFLGVVLCWFPNVKVGPTQFRSVSRCLQLMWVFSSNHGTIVQACGYKNHLDGQLTWDDNPGP